MAEPFKGDWQQLDIEELRARETCYRERLAHQAAMAARLSRYSESLQRMLRSRPPVRAHLASTLLEVAKLSSLALDIARTSVWLFDPQHRNLVCTVQLIAQQEQPVDGLSIDVSVCPAYIAALNEAHALAVENVLLDARTAQLEANCRAHDVMALLDIPIAIAGTLIGVVCHEHVGSPRDWHREEIEFAANVGSLVALALETERRLSAEHAALGSEAKYKYLVESLPVVVYAFDLKTSTLEYVSPRAYELGGWAAEEWLSKGAQGWLDLIHPDDRAPVLERFRTGPGTMFRDEVTYRVNLPDGNQRWIRDTCHVVRDHLGKPFAMQGILSDVSLQVESELERKEVERRQRFLFENADLHAVMLDCDARITYVNDYLARTTGFSREQLRGKIWFELTSPASERARLVSEFREAMARAAVPTRVEGPLHTAAGDTRQVLWTNTLLRRTDGGVQGTSSIGVDLTQRLRLETELLQQTKLESLGRLAAGVAHDFNNLLTVMTSETMSLRPVATSNAARISHAALSEALSQATALTHSLLVYGRQEPVGHDAVPLDGLIEDSLQLMAAMAGPDVQIEFALRSPGACVVLDRAQLRQVLLNLVSNAADATRGQGDKIRVATHIELIEPALARRHAVSGARARSEFVVLSVEDNGHGMDLRTLARIFDPFFTTKPDGRGTGLGLAMCQSIVSRADGFIDVQSEPHTATRFRVYLPRASSALLQAEPDLLPRSPESILHPVRILVVEDLAAIRRLLVNGLRDAGYRVYAAESVAAATQILASTGIDLLITDGSLTDGSGQVLARSARAVRPELRVVLVSGSADGDEEFDAVLRKPFDTADLLQIVAELAQRLRPDPSR
jgi:PAS domain S-box-containing protein